VGWAPHTLEVGLVGGHTESGSSHVRGEFG